MVVILTTVCAVTALTLTVCKIFSNWQDIHSECKTIFSNFSNKLTVDIDELDEMYEAVEIYWGNKLSSNEVRLGLSKPEKRKNFKIINEAIDVYKEHKFKWEKNSKAKAFKLTFHKKNKDLVLEDYLPYIMKEAKLSKEGRFSLWYFMLTCITWFILFCFLLLFGTSGKEAKLSKEGRFSLWYFMRTCITWFILFCFLLVFVTSTPERKRSERRRRKKKKHK